MKWQTSSKSTDACTFCNKTGHTKPNCFAYLRKKRASNNSFSKPVAFTKSVPCSVFPENYDQFKGSMSDISEGYLPFITEGFVSLGERELDPPKYPVVILGDTGASQSLILEDVAPLDEQSYTRTNVLVTGVGNECI